MMGVYSFLQIAHHPSQFSVSGLGQQDHHGRVECADACFYAKTQEESASVNGSSRGGVPTVFPLRRMRTKRVARTHNAPSASGVSAHEVPDYLAFAYGAVRRSLMILSAC